MSNSPIHSTTRVSSSVHFICQVSDSAPNNNQHFPYVVLFHGWLGTSLDLLPLSNHLNSLGYPTVLPDLPYHGKSSAVRPKSLANTAWILAEAVGKILNATSDHPISVVLLGYSLGGRIALELAQLLSVDHTALVIKAVVLLSSAPPPKSHVEIAERAKTGKHLAGRIKELAPTREAFLEWLHEWYGLNMWGNLKTTEGYDEMVQRRLRHLDETTKEAFADAAEVMATYDAAVEIVLKMPALYLYGERDVKYKGFRGTYMTLFETCKVEVVKNAGHNVLMQGAATVRKAVGTFLGEYYIDEKETLKIRDVKLLRYSLPMKKEIVVNGALVGIRAGVLVAVESRGRFVGVGDICPLPGVHVNNLQDCIKEVETFCERLKERANTISRTLFSLTELEKLLGGISNVSRNGITCALICLMMRAWDLNMAVTIQLLISNCRISPLGEVKGYLNCLDNVCFNGVLPRLYAKGEDCGRADTDRRKSISNILQNSCFDVLKVKVGCVSFPTTDGHLIREALEEAKPRGQRLRLDANRAWTKQQFKDFQRGLGVASADIEFIEEPFRNRDDLVACLHGERAQFSLNIALDESLCDSPLELIRSLALSSSCKALIVKPAVIGSLTRTLEFFKIAVQSDCDVILSTVFDSGVGIAWTSLLASVFGDQETRHGLGTFQYLSRDIIENSFEASCVLHNSSLSIEKCHDFLFHAAKLVLGVGISVALTENCFTQV